MQQENIQLIQIKSDRKNIRYQKGQKECKVNSDGLITFIDGNDNSKIMYLYIFDYLFNHSISNLDKFYILFNKEQHVVENEIIKNNISDIQCEINLDNNSIYLFGNDAYLRFRIGERYLRWYNSLFSMFNNSYITYFTNKNGVNELSYNQLNQDKNILVFLNGYKTDLLNVIEINNNSNGICEINSIKSNNIESILLNYSNKNDIDLLVKIQQIPCKFQTIAQKYGTNVAIKLLGYTPYSLHQISLLVSYFIKNESNSSLISLVILLLFMQGIPYILLLIIRLLRKKNNNKNKHINDNEDTFSYVISLIIKNWKYIINVFIIYSIYGITSSRNILQKLDINDGTILNFGKSILDDDNTFLFLKTRFGYFSILKLILFLSLTFKQFSFMSNNSKIYDQIDNNRKIIMTIIMLIFIYAMKINYSFMIIIVITNLFLGFGDVAINNMTS
ncbi:hypothetical protein IOLA_139 [uncultured bacterium]|nr:hypothetical protein IOLA_139 [uncultured bacterium]